MSEKRKIALAAGIMSFATAISRVLGFVRDMVVAFFFGATGLSDSFFVAFRIPNLLRELFAEGSMSAAVVPVMNGFGSKGPDAQSHLARVVLGFIITVVGAVCILGVIFAPLVVSVVAPGFKADPAKFAQTVLLTRVMFPFLLFVSLAALIMGALNVKRVFFIPALAPAALNIVIIASVFAFASRLGEPVLAVAIGVAVGGLVQFLFQCPSFLKNGYSLRPAFGFRDEGLRKIITLVLPITFGMAVSQINIVVSNVLASYLAEGSITHLYYSMRLIHLPIGVFGVAMGMAVLPSLSAHAQNKDFNALREDFSFSLRLLFFVCVPAMAGLIALAIPIVNTLFQRGHFDYDATIGTSNALFYYSLGIWAFVGVRVSAAGFYSMQDTKTPVIAASVSLATNIAFSLALMPSMKQNGLALANSLGAAANFIMLMFFLRRKLHGIDGANILKSFAKTVFASLVMGACAYLIATGRKWCCGGEEFQKAAYLAVAILVSIVVYLIVLKMLGSAELEHASGFVRRRLGAWRGRRANDS